jgi:hypothetical protein
MLRTRQSANPHATTKLVLVLPEIPDASHSGDGITELGLIEGFSSIREVTLNVVALRRPARRYDFEPPSGSASSRVSVILDRETDGADKLSEKILLKFSRILGLGDFLQAIFWASEVKRVVDTLKPDAVVAYHWHAAFASRKVTQNRLVVLGDPLAAAMKQQTIFDAPQLTNLRLGRKVANYFKFSAHKQLIKFACARAHVAAFSPFHASEYSFVLQRFVSYVRTPYPKRVGAKVRRSVTPRNPARVLLMGQLLGSASNQGIRFFESNVLPHLSSEIESGRIEVRIAGGPTAAISESRFQRLRDEGVRFLGHVYPPEPEIANASVAVVPTSIPLGNRVRILKFWEESLPVIAHYSNAAGIPEMIHEENCLLATSGAEMADQIIRLTSKGESLAEKIAEGGHRTLGLYYGSESSARRILSLLRLPEPS